MSAGFLGNVQGSPNNYPPPFYSHHQLSSFHFRFSSPFFFRVVDRDANRHLFGVLSHICTCRLTATYPEPYHSLIISPSPPFIFQGG